jgi:hypothetical protein
MRILLAIRTESEANLRENWHVKAKRVQTQRQITRVMVGQHQKDWRDDSPGVGYVITLTRIAPRPLDSDNLARSFKAIRDGIADALGIDDGSKRLTWNYAQEKGPPKQYAVRIQIEQEGRRS